MLVSAPTRGLASTMLRPRVTERSPRTPEKLDPLSRHFSLGERTYMKDRMAASLAYAGRRRLFWLAMRMQRARADVPPQPDVPAQPAPQYRGP